MKGVTKRYHCLLSVVSYVTVRVVREMKKDLRDEDCVKGSGKEMANKIKYAQI